MIYLFLDKLLGYRVITMDSYFIVMNVTYIKLYLYPNELSCKYNNSTCLKYKLYSLTKNILQMAGATVQVRRMHKSLISEYRKLIQAKLLKSDDYSTIVEESIINKKFI